MSDAPQPQTHDIVNRANGAVRVSVKGMKNGAMATEPFVVPKNGMVHAQIVAQLTALGFTTPDPAIVFKSPHFKALSTGTHRVLRAQPSRT